jgi:hypothetical protein
MAQGTCSNATFKGNYLAINESGELAAAVHIYAEGLFVLNGDGTGTGNLNYTETDGLLNGTQTESFTYTVNSDCSLSGNGSLAGIPVTVKGHILPDGSRGTFVTQTATVAMNGQFIRQ